MLQIALVPNQHDYDVRVGVVSEFLQPPRYVDVSSMLGDIVDKQGSHSSAVVTVNVVKINKTRPRIGENWDIRGSDGSVPFLTSYEFGVSIILRTVTRLMRVHSRPTPSSGNSLVPPVVCAAMISPTTHQCPKSEL